MRLIGGGCQQGVERSVVKTLGRLDQFLAMLPYLGDPLRQLIARPFSNAILSGPQPIELAFAKQIRSRAGPVRAAVLFNYRPKITQKTRANYEFFNTQLPESALPITRPLGGPIKGEARSFLPGQIRSS